MTKEIEKVGNRSRVCDSLGLANSCIPGKQTLSAELMLLMGQVNQVENANHKCREGTSLAKAQYLPYRVPPPLVLGIF